LRLGADRKGARAVSGIEDFGGDLRYHVWHHTRHPEKIVPKPSKEFISPKTLIAPGPAGYSHVAKVNRGTIVYLSGQVPSDASGKLIGEGDFEAQVEQVFANLKLAVEAAGGTMADIVKLNYYIVPELDSASVPKLRPIRDRYINTENPPASTFVVVNRLMRPGWLIEIEAIAALDA
jgi:enamine deaminase RidA (YjgF/YER057c/UK114 family)